MLLKFKTPFWRSVSVQSLRASGLDSSCVTREHCQTMTVVVQCQRPLSPENVSRPECLLKKNPKLTCAKLTACHEDSIRESHSRSSRLLWRISALWVPYNLSEQVAWTGEQVGWTGEQVGWTGAPTCSENLTEEGLLALGILLQEKKSGYTDMTKPKQAVWVFPEENPTVKFRRKRLASRQMTARFSAKDRKTVTAGWGVNH